MKERSLLLLNIFLLVFFANVYYFLSLSDSVNHFKDGDSRQSYMYYYGISAQSAVSGPQNFKSDLGIIIGIFQLVLTIYINVIELSSNNDTFVLRGFTKIIS